MTSEHRIAWGLLVVLILLKGPGAVASRAAEEADAAKSVASVVPAETASIEALTERVRKSVVVITSGGRDGRNDGMGSGFILSADGLIATNFHVIGEGRSVRVQLADGKQYDAQAIHASDRTLDLAVLKIDAKDLPVLELGDSDTLKQGQSVVAFGSPRGLKNSVVSGVVSGVREVEGRPMIQVAIPIEPGNSGGPLVDLQGRAQGIMTMKSLVTPNLGFALTVNLLKPLLAKPNPIPMSRWLTIGALDARQWMTLFGARWRQRAGRISVDGLGSGFGGRSLCLSQAEVPKRPFEIAVSVQLDNEAGAAGLAFCSDGAQRHYGFYPTAGRMRLTRFDGPEVTDWKILYDEPNRHYEAGEWNTLRVRLEEGKIHCFVNDHSVVEVADTGLTSGQVGLVKFRDTKAQFKNFQLGADVASAVVPIEQIQQIERLIENLPMTGALEAGLVKTLAADPARASVVLRERAATLDRQAERLRKLAQAAHERRVTDDLLACLTGDEDKIDLFRAGMLVAKLDNEEVEIESYCQDLDQMGHELAAKLPADADDAARLAALRKYLFEENGFHGSRGDFYNRANSYLNEVLDDREGLPITLSILYMELAKRIGLKVVGLGLPGHFVVAYVPAEGPQQMLDVFDGATSVSREDAAKRVKVASERDLTEDLLAPMPKRAIISRMVTNLLGVTSEDAAAHRYLNVLLAIEPAHGQFHFLRAMVHYRLGDYPASREDVTWLLDHQPPEVPMGRVMALQAALEKQ